MTATFDDLVGVGRAESEARPRGPWVQTHSGVPFDLLAPRVEDVRMGDVQRHLSRIARYSGATLGSFGYTVAQHSVLCADLIRTWGGDARLEREAMLHDAPETFYGDVTHPVQLALGQVYRETIRRTLAEVAASYAYVQRDGDDVAHRHEGRTVEKAATAALEQFAAKLEETDPLRELKARIDPIVRQAIGLEAVEPPLVKRADLVALAIERKYVMASCEREWSLPELADTRFKSLEPEYPPDAYDAFVRRLDEIDRRIASE